MNNEDGKKLKYAKEVELEYPKEVELEYPEKGQPKFEERGYTGKAPTASPPSDRKKRSISRPPKERK